MDGGQEQSLVLPEIADFYVWTPPLPHHTSLQMLNTDTFLLPPTGRFEPRKRRGRGRRNGVVEHSLFIRHSVPGFSFWRPERYSGANLKDLERLGFAAELSCRSAHCGVEEQRWELVLCERMGANILRRIQIM